MKSILGIIRSIRTYHREAHICKMVSFYRPFVEPGDLVFDIGAHVGDRTRAFLRLGCKVVAVEPQPALALVLRLMHAHSPDVEIVAAAVNDGGQTVTLSVNRENPTVSTASRDFIQSAKAGAPGWEGQRWDREIEVPGTTLDRLIAKYGTPAFVKIDVEGFEERALMGLSKPLPALSFEFTTHQRSVALRAMKRLQSLGQYHFNACLGESWVNVFDAPRSEEEIADWLNQLPAKANSGDIYCKLL